jgi:hypothetical protein
MCRKDSLEGSTQNLSHPSHLSQSPVFAAPGSRRPFLAPRIPAGSAAPHPRSSAIPASPATAAAPQPSRASPPPRGAAHHTRAPSLTAADSARPRSLPAP